mgnify:CR=1 FL=1
MTKGLLWIALAGILFVVFTALVFRRVVYLSSCSCCISNSRFLFEFAGLPCAGQYASENGWGLALCPFMTAHLRKPARIGCKKKHKTFKNLTSIKIKSSRPSTEYVPNQGLPETGGLSLCAVDAKFSWKRAARPTSFFALPTL